MRARNRRVRKACLTPGSDVSSDIHKFLRENTVYLHCSSAQDPRGRSTVLDDGGVGN